MNVLEFLKVSLKEKGYDGLCIEDCGCTIDEDFTPCGETPYYCEPGYLHPDGTVRPEKP